jgi:hypothetical protein
VDTQLAVIIAERVWGTILRITMVDVENVPIVSTETLLHILSECYGSVTIDRDVCDEIRTMSTDFN